MVVLVEMVVAVLVQALVTQQAVLALLEILVVVVVEPGLAVQQTIQVETVGRAS
jgi:hypothetical protein